MAESREMLHRTAIGRWKKRDSLMRAVPRNVGAMPAFLLSVVLAIIGPTPLVDYRNPDARTSLLVHKSGWEPDFAGKTNPKWGGGQTR